MKKLLSVLLCLSFVISLAIPLYIPSAAVGTSELVYSEDFNNITDAASLGYDPDARAKTYAASAPAALSIVDGRLQASLNSNAVSFIKVLPADVMKNFSSFTVEFDMQIDTLSGGAAGLVLYWPEYLGTTSGGTNTYHTLQFRNNYTQFLHATNKNSTWDGFALKNLTDYGVQNVGLGTSHKIRVEADGANVKSYIDGIMVSEVNNAVYYESPLCLLVFNTCVVYYDNLKVWAVKDNSIEFPSYFNGQVIYSEDYEDVSDASELPYNPDARANAGGTNSTVLPQMSIDTNDTKRLKIYNDNSNLYFVKFLDSDALRGVDKFTVQYDLQANQMSDLFGLGLYWPEHLGSTVGNVYHTAQYRSGYTTYLNSGRSSSTWFNYPATLPTLASAGVQNTGLTTNHTMKVEVEGKTVKSYVDNILIDTKTNAMVYDSPLFFIVYKTTEVYIDNVVVWAGTGVEPVEVFDYHGFSIRIEDPNGLRAMYSLSKDVIDATVAQDGYKLVEYGMILAQRESYDASEGLAGAELLLATDNSERNNTGKVTIWQNGAQTGNIYKQTESRNVYTAVLINIKNANLDKAYAFRAYCIIENGAGERSVIYSDSNEKSIYDVAKLALADEGNGLTAEQEAYLQTNIINIVEGVG